MTDEGGESLLSCDDDAMVGSFTVDSDTAGAGRDSLSSASFLSLLADLENISDSVESVLSASLFGMSDGESRESVRLFEQVASRVQAARLHLIADLDARPGAVPGAAAGRVAQTFLVGACRVGAGQAARDVAAARALPVAAAMRAAVVGDVPGEATGASEADVVAPGSLLGGGACVRLPVLAAAFAAGAVSRAHVDVAVKAVGRLPSAQLGECDAAGVTGLSRVDAFVTDQARRHSPSGLDRLVRHLVEVADPDGTGGFDPRAYERRSCTTAVDGLGMLVGRFVLDPIGAVTFATALDAFASLPPTGSAAGSAAGEDGELRDVVDSRTRDRRRADALVLMAEHAMASPAAPQRAQVSVITRVDQVERAARAHSRHRKTASGTCEPDPADRTATRTATTRDPAATREVGGRDVGGRDVGGRGTEVADSVTSAGAVGDGPGTDASDAPDDDGPWLAHAEAVGPISDAVLAHVTCDAVLTRLTLSPTGAPLDVGRSLRLATPAQRKALAARDRGCVIPGCGVPAHGCDAHHVVHWADGGATDLDNLVLLCSRHHAAHHQGVWHIQIRDGIPWVIPPTWLDPHQQPMLNTTHHDAAHATRLGRHLRTPHGPSDMPRPTGRC